MKKILHGPIGFISIGVAVYWLLLYGEQYFDTLYVRKFIAYLAFLSIVVAAILQFTTRNKRALHVSQDLALTGFTLTSVHIALTVYMQNSTFFDMHWLLMYYVAAFLTFSLLVMLGKHTGIVPSKEWLRLQKAGFVAALIAAVLHTFLIVDKTMLNDWRLQVPLIAGTCAVFVYAVMGAKKR